MSRNNRISYPVLLAENEPRDLQFYKNGIKNACQGDIWLEFSEYENILNAQSAIYEKSFAFMSLDQNMPLKKNGPVIQGKGGDLALLASKLNPLTRITILTAYPEWKVALLAGNSGVDYVCKKEITARDYGKLFVNNIKKFERTHAWEIGAEQLPPMLSCFCENIFLDSTSSLLKKNKDALSLWDTGIRFLALSQIAILDFLKCSVADIDYLLQRRLDNEPVLRIIEKSTPLIIKEFDAGGLSVQAREYKRFFSNDNFRKATRRIQQIRNEEAHSPAAVNFDIFDTDINSFVTFLLGMSFWALHPLVMNLKIVPWRNRNALQVNRLTKNNFTLGCNEVFNWADKDLFIHPDHLYQVVLDPEKTDEGSIVPLYPLIRIEGQDNDKNVWLAHDPMKDEYRNPINGNTKSFGDSDLSSWCKKKVKSPEKSIEFPGITKKEILVEPREGEEVKANLHNKIRSLLKEFYLPKNTSLPEKTDSDYQTSFYGIPKAKEVLSFLSTHRNIPPERLAYVSIGGADGSEIAYVMNNSRITYGILLEYSDYGAAEARRLIEFLARSNKEFVVFHGDAMQRINDCGKQLFHWKQNNLVDGVILSVQSVFHELPFRSPQYDINILLGQIFNPFKLRIFHSREPAKPNGWPETVHLRIHNISGENLYAISRQINDVLNFSSEVASLADDFVQMSSELAVETLFKIMYCEDGNRYRYEMDERLTAFNPTTFTSILKNFINPQENVEFQYLISDSFRSRYKSHKVEARSTTGEKLGIPQTFVRITGIQETLLI